MIAPIIVAQRTMSLCSIARLTPTASASMLVAMASGSIARTPNSALFESQVCAVKDSHIIFAPMSASKALRLRTALA